MGGRWGEIEENTLLRNQTLLGHVNFARERQGRKKKKKTPVPVWRRKKAKGIRAEPSPSRRREREPINGSEKKKKGKCTRETEKKSLSKSKTEGMEKINYPFVGKGEKKGKRIPAIRNKGGGEPKKRKKDRKSRPAERK